jgi:hypothetical protein
MRDPKKAHEVQRKEVEEEAGPDDVLELDEELSEEEDMDQVRRKVLRARECRTASTCQAESDNTICAFRMGTRTKTKTKRRLTRMQPCSLTERDRYGCEGARVLGHRA